MEKQRYDTRIVGYKDGKAVYGKVARPIGARIITRAERRNVQFNRADTGNHTRDGHRPPKPEPHTVRSPVLLDAVLSFQRLADAELLG